MASTPHAQVSHHELYFDRKISEQTLPLQATFSVGWPYLSL